MPSSVYSQAKDKMKGIHGAKLDVKREFDLNADFFSNETKIGFLNATGNTHSISVNGSNFTHYRYKRYKNTWNLGAYYFHVFSVTDKDNSIGTIANYIYGTYRFDYFLKEYLTVFVSGGGYTDGIKGVDIAGDGSTGVQVYFLRKEDNILSMSYGYNFTYKKQSNNKGTRQINAALIELYYFTKFNKTVSFRESLEILEDVLDGYDLRVNNTAELKVDMTTHLALALSVGLSFDNRPTPGYKKLDTFTRFSLVVTF